MFEHLKMMLFIFAKKSTEHIMEIDKNIKQQLSYLPSDLIKEIQDSSTIQSIPKGTEILREGQYVKVVPIVLEGLIKVFTRHDDKELLIYYIKPSDTCIMSFASGLKNEPSPVFAITEEDTKAILMPVDKIPFWTRNFPDINALFYQQYKLRYNELLETIHHVLFDKMDKRILDYLKEKIRLTGKNSIKISHREIANELGTAREVVSRVLKKLEVEGSVAQDSDGIKIF